MTAITEGYRPHQRPFKIKRSIRDILHKHSRHKHDQLNPPLPQIPSEDDMDINEYAFDVLFECQRGSLSVGYSSKTLLQFDPNPWCDRNMRYTPMNIEDYQLPDPTWRWASKHWMIDMSGDVDEAGWQYAIKFHGAKWHGNYKHFRSFVRRRRWVRLRYKPRCEIEENPVQLVDVDIPISPTTTNDNRVNSLLEQLKKCRLDRERMAVMDEALQSSGDIVHHISLYLSYFDYEESKLAFLKKIFHLQYPSSDPSLLDDIKKTIESLHYYSDCESILDSLP